METFRFSVGTHPCLESRHHTCLDLKGITIRPTRPEGKMKGLRHKEQREEEEHEHQRDHDDLFRWFFISSHTGNSNNWERSHDSCMKPPGGLLYWPHANQLSNSGEYYYRWDCLPSPHPSRWGEVFCPLDTAHHVPLLTISGLPT